MAENACGHKAGLLGGLASMSIDKVAAGIAGRPEWGGQKICVECKQMVRLAIEGKIESMPILTVQIVHGYEVEQYLGIVTGQSVVGTGAVSEFLADITDFLGDESGALGKKIRSGESASTRMMKQRALAKGADAIIGANLNYGELGGDRGMLMVTSTGTAVRWRKLQPQ